MSEFAIPVAAASSSTNVSAADGYELGVPWIDHGAKCDGQHDPSTGCFLSDAGRMRLLFDFRHLVDKAGENYKLALLELKVQELIEAAP